MDKTLVAHIKSSNSWWRKRWGQKMGSAQVAWAMWQGEQCHNWILNEGFFHLCPGNCIPTVELVGHELKYNGVPATVEEYIPLWAPSYNADERWKKIKEKKKVMDKAKRREKRVPKIHVAIRIWSLFSHWPIYGDIRSVVLEHE